MRYTKLNQNRWKTQSSFARSFFHLFLQHLFENIKNFTFRNFIWLWMIWVACLLKNLNRWICNNIIIVVFFNKISIFVNFVRSNFISLSKICSKCSMKNSKKKFISKSKQRIFSNIFRSNANHCLFQIYNQSKIVNWSNFEKFKIENFETTHVCEINSHCFQQNFV